MELPNNLVLSNGRLNDDYILKKEILYKGINGNLVERFYLSPTESYVFKQLAVGNGSQEVWVYENILPAFPPIYPELVAHEANWVIFEDLGKLSHDFKEESVLGVIKLMAGWHSLPYENAPLTGLKPSFEKIIAEVRAKRLELERLLPELNIDERLISNAYLLLESVEFSKKMVLSHGDLHIGNYCFHNNRLIVLDWEHTHINLPYWDLYHILDMSHPLFPKKITSEFRWKVLNTYLDDIGIVVDRAAFIKEYYLFSTVFSMWMIMLIFEDLHSDELKWPKEKLEDQLNESVLNLIQCGSFLL